MGSILSETRLVQRIDHIITPIKDMFAAVFFISVGMMFGSKRIVGALVGSLSDHFISYLR